jgi:hypothetical protein
MKQTLLQEKYPIFVAEIGKNETTYRSVDELVAYYQAYREPEGAVHRRFRPLRPHARSKARSSRA